MNLIHPALNDVTADTLGGTCNVTCNGPTRYKMILILFVFSVGLDYLNDFIHIKRLNVVFKHKF